MKSTDNRGIALLITLSVVTIMVTVTVALNRRMRNSITDAAVSRDRIIMTHMIDSAVNMACVILAKDKREGPADSLQDDWADPEVVADYLAQIPFDDGEIRMLISDERARLQINALVSYPKGRDFNPAQRELWYRFFDLLLAQQDESADKFISEPIVPDMIINPVKDWLDFGDDDAISGLTGAEDNYYRDLDPPYSCRNGPIRQIAELMRIKGITPELFAGLDMGGAGIGAYITVSGMSETPDHKFTFDGKININTADVPVMAALLPAGQEFLAQAICDFRVEKASESYMHDLTSPTWYKDVPGCADVTINADLITTSSDIFHVEVGAILNDTSMRAAVLLEREKNKKIGKWQCKVLNWTFK
ncbi:MAG: general secretion pathway protein GspK [Deltaproteobacteria bacterium]|nr:general secretion pathway protein GspK [Deltaproteobacteria bacterium]